MNNARVRHNVRPLESWSGGLEAEHLWIDRLKLAVPSIGLSVDCDEGTFVRYLEGRRAVFQRDVEVDRPHAGSLHISFPATSWLFRCQINLKFVNNRWIGAGTIEVNPTRLLANVGHHTDLRERNGFAVSELSTSRVIRSDAFTLDGKDNFVSESLLRQASNIRWPNLTQVYVSSVLATVTELLGSSHDLQSNNRPQIWLLRTAPPSDWTIKEVEFYREFAETSAPLRVAEMADVSRGLSSVFGLDDHGPAVFGERRVDNLPAMQLGLGREGVYLAIYAKTFERLRMEVRYKKAPCRAAGLTRGRYSSPDTWLRDMLADMRLDAVNRMNAYLAGYRRQRGGEPTLLSLAICLPKIAAACLGNEMLTHRVLSLLIINGGLTRSDNEALNTVIDNLVASGVLHRVRTTARGDLRTHTVKPRFRSAIQTLRVLPVINQNARQTPR